MEQPFYGDLEIHNASSSSVEGLALSLPAEEIPGFGMRLMVLLHALHLHILHLGHIHELYGALLWLVRHAGAPQEEEPCDSHLISMYNYLGQHMRTRIQIQYNTSAQRASLHG